MHVEEIKKRIEEQGYEWTGEVRQPVNGDYIFSIKEERVIKYSMSVYLKEYFIVTPKKWEPKEGEKVWWIVFHEDIIEDSKITSDFLRYAPEGLEFRTEELAQNCLDKMIEVFEQSERG